MDVWLLLLVDQRGYEHTKNRESSLMMGFGLMSQNNRFALIYVRWQHSNKVKAQANSWRVCRPSSSFSIWTVRLPRQLFRGRLPSLANNSVIENVNQVPERIFQTGCELSLGRQLLKWEEFHDNLTSGTPTQLCFLIFHRQQSPLLHLVCGWGASSPNCSS